MLYKINNDKLLYCGRVSVTGTSIPDEGDLNLETNINIIGRYMALLNINHISADQISNVGYWTFRIFDSAGLPVTINDRTNGTSLVIPHTWDTSAATIADIVFVNTGKYTFKAINHTGKTTSTQYASQFTVRLFRVSSN